MQQHYQDAMAITRAKSRPDLLITMTCNPKWKELKMVLKNFPSGTTPNDIPNITVRLFYAKFNSFLNDILKNKIFGEVLAYVYTIEFQKRGLPHAHIVVTLHPNHKIMTPASINKYISAEIPNNSNKDLQKLVIKHMLHGPHTNTSPCFKKNSKTKTTSDKNFQHNINTINTTCEKNFPKEFCENTTFKENGYPLYRRRDNRSENHTYSTKKHKQIIPVDNRMVVPYNSFLLQKYKCHINVEYCASIQSIKYIFDYIHKGGDRALCKIQKIDNKENDKLDTVVHDEITQFIDGRYLSAMEAAWRLQEFPLCGRSHTVTRLAVHTKDQQKIIFEEHKESEALRNTETTLTAWLKLNKTDNFARNIKYVEIPQYYRFDQKTKSWKKRSRNYKYGAIGRLNVVSPKDSERFFLKLILNRMKGATSFEDLRTYKNTLYQTYKEAALAMGLVADDSCVYNIFEEACQIMLPFQLRKFFAWFILAENIQGNTIWNKFKNFFTEDFKTNKENNALSHIQSILETEERCCKDFSLPEPDNLIINDDMSSENIMQSATIFKQMVNELNEDQHSIFTELINSKTNIYFIDGPGGSGKTFLYKTLIHYYISLKKQVLSMAWTGIASILLPKGMTSHRTFRLPLDLDNVDTAFLKLESDKKN